MVKDRSQLIGRRDLFILGAAIGGSGALPKAWSQEACAAPAAEISRARSPLSVLTLTSAEKSGVRPWTFGCVFKKGDVPSGSRVAATAFASQLDVRNRWSDGSVKFAVLSGLTRFTGDRPATIALIGAQPAQDSANVSEPANLHVAVSFTGDVSGTYTLQSCLGIDRSTWRRESQGRVRQLLGPVMSEFHYYCPTSDAHVAVWFYVRQYSTGDTEIETVVENGWLNVPDPGQRNYEATVTINGKARFSDTVNHFHHTRWSRVDWVGTDPKITPKHDAGYLRSSRLVPNYGYTSPSAAASSRRARSCCRASPMIPLVRRASWPR